MASGSAGGSSGPGATNTTNGQDETAGQTSATQTSAATSGGLGGVCEGPLSDSYIAWGTVRDGAEGSYTFTILDTLVYADHCRGEVYIACNTTTTFTVVDDQVVARAFVAGPASPETLPGDCPEAYTEEAETLGDNAEGHPVETLDAVYMRCCDMAEMQGGYHTDYSTYRPGDVVVSIGDDGLLESCSTEYCDDCGCFGGPNIQIGGVMPGAS